MSTAPRESAAIVSSAPTLLISAGNIEPKARKKEKEDRTDIKSFPPSFPKKSLIKV